jgi:hypothetical protein
MLALFLSQLLAVDLALSPEESGLPGVPSSERGEVPSGFPREMHYTERNKKEGNFNHFKMPQIIMLFILIYCRNYQY